MFSEHTCSCFFFFCLFVSLISVIVFFRLITSRVFELGISNLVKRFIREFWFHPKWCQFDWTPPSPPKGGKTDFTSRKVSGLITYWVLNLAFSKFSSFLTKFSTPPLSSVSLIGPPLPPKKWKKLVFLYVKLCNSLCLQSRVLKFCQKIPHWILHPPGE